MGFKIFIKLAPFFLKNKLKISAAFLSLFLTAISILAFGKIVKYLIDNGLARLNFVEVNVSFALCFILILILSFCGYIRSLTVNSLCEKLINEIRKKIFLKLLKSKIIFFENNNIGGITSIITSDMEIISQNIGNNFSFFIRNLILFISSLIFLFLTSVKLTFIALIMIIIAISPVYFFSKKIKKLTSQSVNNLSNLVSFIEEVYSSIKVVKSYNSEERQLKSFTKTLDKITTSNINKIRNKSLLVAITLFFAFSSIILVLWVGGIDVLSLAMTSGELTSFIFYCVIASVSLTGLSQISSQVIILKNSFERIFNILDNNEDESCDEASSNIQNFYQPQILFKNVTFSYPSSKNNFILSNFNLDITYGQKVLLTGKSGSGKSTILSLLLGFYKINTGIIKISDKNIEDINLNSLRNIFSYISQDCFLFSGTIYENIAYFSDASKGDVEKLVENYKIFSFIKDLPQGLDTQIGSKGFKLSGGEKQRISIARALLKNSQIYLFDEPTSSLDYHNHSLVLDLIKDISFNKTIIVVSHQDFSEINFDIKISL